VRAASEMSESEKSQKAQVLLYGGSGYTATLIRSESSDADAISCAARRLPPGGAGECLQLGLDDPDALRRVLEGYAVVLNCAGPFATTWRPLVEACIDTGTHYLDVAAEWAVFEEMQEFDTSARERGVMLLPGVGFDVVASDCLAAHVAEQLPGATRLQIGISGLELLSRGSVRTLLDLAGKPTCIRRDGVLASISQPGHARFDFGRGPSDAIGVSWGDVATAYCTTGIPNVEVYFEATPATLGLDLWNRGFGWLLKNPALQNLARGQLGWLPEGPSAPERARRRAAIVARVEDEGGQCVEARLETPEAYTFTAASALAIARRVLAGTVEPGFQTPGRLLGPDFPLTLPGVVRSEAQTGPSQRRE
jgi:short subunit dehydrogenase-like uncharacterized protein